MKAADYMDKLEKLIVNSPIILSSQTRERRIRRFDAYIKIKLILTDNSTLEVNEFVHAERENHAKLKRYSYHWMDASGQLRLRWDNVGHYPKLPGFPHHLHDHDEKRVVPSAPMTLAKVLATIQLELKSIGEPKSS